MDAREAKHILRETLMEHGFVRQGKQYCKRISEGYSLRVLLDKPPSSKAYSIELGAVYEPETSGCDISEWLLFTAMPGDSLEKYDLTVRSLPRQSPLTDCFDYENRSAEEFRESLRLNLERKLPLWQNPEYGLELFRKDWMLFRAVSDETLEKVARLAGLDADEVRMVCDSRRTKWPRDYFDGSEILRALVGCRLENCFRVGTQAELQLVDEAENRSFLLKIQCGLQAVRGGEIAADFRDLLPMRGEAMAYNPRKPKESPVAFDRDMAEFIDQERSHAISTVKIAGDGAFDAVFDDGNGLRVFPKTEDVHADLWALKSEQLSGLMVASRFGCWYE